MPETQNTNRRDFLKTTTTAAVGVGVLGAISTPVGAFAGGNDTIKIGLVGCGGRGTAAVGQALSTDGNVKLVAMADAFSDRMESCHGGISRRFKERVAVDNDHKFVGFDGYKNVINSGIDLIILATPPGFRPIHVEAAIAAGKHVFMEKPVATDAPGVRKVLAAVEVAKKKNLKIGVGLQRHHEVKYLETMNRLKDGAIGDIIAMRCYWNGAGVWVRERLPEQTEMEYQMRNWYYFNWLCGDHICEQHIHNLDVCNWLKDGFPVRANGMGGREVRKGRENGQIFDHHAVEFEYADGTRMFSQCRHIPDCWRSVSEHAAGSKGTCDISGAAITAAKNWKYAGPKPNPYQVEHDDLFAAVRNDTPYNEGEYGAMSTMTSILGRMATYSGKIVEMEKALNSKISLMPKEFAWDAAPPVLPDEDGKYPVAVPGRTVVI
ncbi:MAG: Gfo/Idh/MocA family oxidoreductase [Planctomycetota bacterium]|nr:Gfo/Idh/MocA family oxidoreductase [Planctomycetota bacterium]